MARRSKLWVYYSSMNVKILEILLKRGFIAGFRLVSNRRIQVFLKLVTVSMELLLHLQRGSLSGRRKYVSLSQLFLWRRLGKKLVILSTAKLGVIDLEEACLNRCSGELLLLHKRSL